MWVKVSQEEARQHPLFGVRGSLLFVGCLMIVLVLLDPPIQIIAKKMAGLRPSFVPSIPFMISIIATWGLFRQKAYVRAYVYVLAVVSVGGFAFLSSLGYLPYVRYETEGALLAVLMKNIPLCSYFTWSRRARVTLECRVRSHDPLLSRGDAPGMQKDARSHDSVTPAAGPAIDHRSSELRLTQQHAEIQSGTPPQDQPQDDLGPEKKFALLLQYSPSVGHAYTAIAHLPQELKQRFRAAVLEPGGHHESDATAARLLHEHHKRMCPFDRAEANDLLAKARELGSVAEREFMEVMELLGPSASPAEVYAGVNNKYGANAILSRRITAWTKDI